MRTFFISSLLLIAFSVKCLPQSLTQNCVYALEHIEAGYVQYGVEELRKMANANSMHAQYFLALCYECGIGVGQDQMSAFKFCRKAAERGLPDAIYRMALYYRNGVAVQMDTEKYNEWINRFNAKGGKLLLPDFAAIYNTGLTHPENYMLDPNGGAMKAGGNNVNSNSTINSNNQTINNITIIQSAPTVVASTEVQTPTMPQPVRHKSDVDTEIPLSPQNNNNAFVLIIANENYQEVEKVPNALNDGEVFSEYCHCALGIPSSNIVLLKDATYNNMKREIGKLSQIVNAYNGTAKIIFYYAGHGIPDESTRDAVLLPVDGYGSDITTGYSLSEIYSGIGKMPAEQIVILLDACFSGSLRGEGMLTSARGVAIKAKPNKAEGNMVVISAAQGDETAYSYQEKGHGLFTYFLLKKLKDSKGSVPLGELATYIKDNVSKKSIVINGKSQTPSVNPSASIGESWKTWTLK